MGTGEFDTCLCVLVDACTCLPGEMLSSPTATTCSRILGRTFGRSSSQSRLRNAGLSQPCRLESCHFYGLSRQGQELVVEICVAKQNRLPCQTDLREYPPWKRCHRLDLNQATCVQNIFQLCCITEALRLSRTSIQFEETGESGVRVIVEATEKLVSNWNNFGTTFFTPHECAYRYVLKHGRLTIAAAEPPELSFFLR